MFTNFYVNGQGHSSIAMIFINTIPLRTLKIDIFVFKVILFSLVRVKMYKQNNDTGIK